MPCGRALLLGCLTLLLSAQAPLPNKVFCFVSEKKKKEKKMESESMHLFIFKKWLTQLPSRNSSMPF